MIRWRRVRRTNPSPAVEDGEVARQREAEQVLGRWDAAVGAVRDKLRTENGQWFLDALEWPVLRLGTLHREGPVPPVEVMAEVLERIEDAQPATAVLKEIVEADSGVLSVAARPRHDNRRIEQFRATTSRRSQAPGLDLLRAVPEDSAHRYVRESLRPVSRALAAVGVDLGTARALTSARWWPGRELTLPHPVARRTDPMSLAGIERSLLEKKKPPGRDWYDALGDADRLARGKGVPPFDPVDWILSALRYRIDVLDEVTR